ncbi:hypothetical protein QWE_08496 [Agrobacterium albertimagni AOL15]|uniref:Uncharacterized protein n=1 Tax=Agrobacterium albertimagni AOL15 TaxID=1156935 RepID=K2Q4K3_9HYPH|nr:hypothetical protein [Agrobacterium albertimagni]EKF60120.1 hypothetical protein QWE_08496 [Agrobacterium albertimagni AOL15]
MFWHGWGLAWGFAFGVAFAGFVYLGSAGADAVWCAADDRGNCLREWISALGGWAAVAAAAPTIYYLSRQVTAAATHEKVNFAIASRANLSLASAARQTAIEVRYQVRLVRQTLGNSGMTRPRQVNHVRAVCELASEWFKRPVFAEFEARIGFADATTVATITVYLDGQVSHMKDLEIQALEGLSVKEFEMLMKRLDGAMNIADKFAEATCASADTFIQEINRLGSRLA